MILTMYEMGEKKCKGEGQHGPYKHNWMNLNLIFLSSSMYFWDLTPILHIPDASDWILNWVMVSFHEGKMDEQPILLPAQVSLFILSQKSMSTLLCVSCLLPEFSIRSFIFSVGFTTIKFSYHRVFLLLFVSFPKRRKKLKSTIKVKQRDWDQGSSSAKWHAGQCLYHFMEISSTKVEFF